MTAIDNIINQIEGETQNRGNTKTRIAAVLRLLRDKIERLFSTKLDKGSYTGTADDLRTSIDGKVDKVLGKILSTNDFTNQLRAKLEGLRNVDISGLLPKGGYTGTAQNLKELIDNIMRILQSPDTELDELREIVAYIKQNKRILDTLGISNIAGLQDALNGKAPTSHNHDDRYSRLGHTHPEYALRTHRHNWDNIDGKPAFNYLPLTGGTVNGDITANSIKKKNSSDSKVLLGGGGEKDISDFDFYKGIINSTDLNVFAYRDTGSYTVISGGGAGILLSFKAWGSTSSLEFYKPDWYPATRIWVRNSVDGNRFNDDNGDFRELAWFDDVKRVGGKIGFNWSATKNWQNGVIFVETSCNIELNQLEDLSSISFRKVFAGGNVTFTCTDKTIIYTGDTDFNGGDGSTAVVSIYGNKCYIDIRNV